MTEAAQNLFFNVINIDGCFLKALKVTKKATFKVLRSDLEGFHITSKGI
jgi:hypothetical protein